MTVPELLQKAKVIDERTECDMRRFGKDVICGSSEG